MSVLCRYCGNRVASVASLAGHYRRKHPERVQVRPSLRIGYPVLSVTGPTRSSGIAPHGAINGLSDAAYIARLAKMESEGNALLPVETDAQGPSTTPLSWWPWALFGAVCFFFALAPDSGSSRDADAGLVSTYQPEGDGQ